MENKLTSIEISNIKEVQDEYTKLVIELGRYEVDVLFLEEELESVKKKKKICTNSLISLKLKEDQIVSKLRDKYPNSSVDLLTGDVM